MSKLFINLILCGKLLGAEGRYVTLPFVNQSPWSSTNKKGSLVAWLIPTIGLPIYLLPKKYYINKGGERDSSRVSAVGSGGLRGVYFLFVIFS